MLIFCPMQKTGKNLHMCEAPRWYPSILLSNGYVSMHHQPACLRALETFKATQKLNCQRKLALLMWALCVQVHGAHQCWSAGTI